MAPFPPVTIAAPVAILAAPAASVIALPTTVAAPEAPAPVAPGLEQVAA